jgi:hypothetical protein
VRRQDNAYNVAYRFVRDHRLDVAFIAEVHRAARATAVRFGGASRCVVVPSRCSCPR